MNDKASETARRESADCSDVSSDVSGDAGVVAHLLEHPDFFARHPEVLAKLEIKHGAPGAASLLEKQVAVLRGENNGAATDRAELIRIARANANLSLCLHETALELLRSCADPSPSCAAKAAGVLQACKTVFEKHVPEVSLTIYWLRGLFADGSRADGVTVLDEGDQRISMLVESLFAAGKFNCEPLERPARAALFGRFASAIRSTVAAPLFEPVTRKRLGVLVLASHDAARFAPGKGTMFLVQLAQLIECAVNSERETRDGKENG